MADYSQLSDNELKALYAQQAGGQSQQGMDVSKMSDAELQRMAAQQQSTQEPTGNLPQPISSDDRANVQAILGSVPPSRIDGKLLTDPELSNDFIRDFRALTGVHPQTLVLDKGTRNEKFAETPQEAFTAAVANGILDPNYKEDRPDIYKNFEVKWNQYKADMDPTMLGAAARGALDSAFPTAVGAAGAFIGSAIGPVGSIGLGMAGGIGAGMLQEELFPPTSAQKAQLAFDKRDTLTRNARLAGELAPSFATLRPTLNSELFKLAPKAVRNFIIGSGLGAGVPAAIDYFQGNKFDPERFAWGVGSAAFLTPNRIGTMLFEKFARTEQLATEARNKMFQDKRFTGISTEEQRQHVLSRLRDYDTAAAEHGILPMLGEYADLPLAGIFVENQALLRLQKALQNSMEGSRMSQRQYENNVRAAIANEKITGKQGDLPEDTTRAFFEAEREKIAAVAQETKDSLIQAGDNEAAAIIAQAEEQAANANKLREAGIIDAEEQVKLANSVFSQAIEEINAARGTSAKASTRAINLLGDLKQNAYMPVKKAYRAIDKNARTDYQNTYKAAKRSISKTNIGSLKDPPPIIKDIVDKYAPKLDRKGEKKLPNERISVMLKDLEAVTEEISKAVQAKENVTVRLLEMVKTGIEKDLAIAGKTWEGIDRAKRMYYEYAQKYVNGTLGAMLHPSQSLDVDQRLSKILYSTSSENKKFNGPQQLLMALNGAGEDMVFQQLLNDMAQKGGESSKSLKKWINSDEVSRVLDVFPFRDKLGAVINNVEDLEIQSRRAAAALAEKQKSPTAKANKQELETAEELKSTVREAAELEYRRETAKLADDAFTAFVGADSRNAMMQVMASKDPVGTATQIMQLVAQDKTGQALVGFQNAMRQHYQEAVRGTKALTTSGIIGDTLKPNQLQVIVSKLNTALVEGGELRNVMNVVLPPSEMQALDKLRAQVQFITAPFRTVSGEPITSEKTAATNAVAEILESNLIGVLGTFARSGSLNKYVQNSWTRATDMAQFLYYGLPSDKIPTGKVAQGFKKFGEEWFGLTGKRMGERAAELLTDAMLNPSTIGIEVLENKMSSPRGRAFVRAYILQKDQLIDKPTILPFNSLNTAEVQLPNGKLFKDDNTGYSIQNTSSKYKVFSPKGEKIGTFDDLESARQHAVNEYNKYITRIKTNN